MVLLGDKAIGRASEVFAQADLGDPRRTRRAVGITAALARRPRESLPHVWNTPAELEAGYRFLRNPKCEFSALLEPYQHLTRQRALEHGQVLVLHDTTDVACQAAEPEEVGFLQTGKPGFFVHHALCIAADETRRPLGMLWSQLWGRAKRSLGRKRNLSGSELSKLDERESDRWLEGVTQAELWADGCQQVVHVMDREADSFRLFEHLQQLQADFVVRLRHDRSTEDGTVAESLSMAELKLERLVPLSKRKRRSEPRYTHQGRPARMARLKVRCQSVELQPPSYLKKTHDPVQVQLVQVLEEDPPQGEEPVSWVLATSLPVRTKADVQGVIDIYRARWVIEEFHKALKTGCMFEKRQLESFESITTLLALSYPVACEILRVRSRARQPGLPASDVLSPTQLQCLRHFPRAPQLPDEPTAQQALDAIAALAGHIKNNGPPGWQKLAAGFRELLAFEQGWISKDDLLTAAKPLGKNAYGAYLRQIAGEAE